MSRSESRRSDLPNDSDSSFVSSRASTSLPQDLPPTPSLDDEGSAASEQWFCFRDNAGAISGDAWGGTCDAPSDDATTRHLATLREAPVPRRRAGNFLGGLFTVSLALSAIAGVGMLAFVVTSRLVAPPSRAELDAARSALPGWNERAFENAPIENDSGSNLHTVRSPEPGAVRVNEPQVAQSAPPSPEIMARLQELWEAGRDAKARGDFAAARRHWEQALRLRPDHPGFQESIDKLPPAS